MSSRSSLTSGARSTTADMNCSRIVWSSLTQVWTNSGLAAQDPLPKYEQIAAWPLNIFLWKTMHHVKTLFGCLILADHVWNDEWCSGQSYAQKLKLPQHHLFEMYDRSQCRSQNQDWYITPCATVNKHRYVTRRLFREGFGLDDFTASWPDFTACGLPTYLWSSE